MINVGRIMSSKNFSQTYTVFRETGSWQNGRWVSSETPIQMTGVITAASPNDLKQVAEGDRVTGSMCFYSQEEMFETRANDPDVKDGTSDQILWNGYRYRVSSVMPWSDYGYYKVIAVRMVAE
jgi:glucose dehydrogenase